VITELTDKTVGDFIKQPGMAVIKAWGEGCIPCVEYLPAFKEVADSTTGVRFGTLKVAKDSPSKFRRTYMVAKKIGEQIGTPMTFIFKDGVEVRKHYGILHADLLRQLMKSDLEQAPARPQAPQQGPRDITKAPIQEIQARGFTLMMQMNAIQNELQVINQELARRGVK